MKTNKPFVLRIALQTALPYFPKYETQEEITKSYATKQGLMQAAHYWAKYYFDGDLWRGGYYTNYTLFMNLSDTGRAVMYAYQHNATKDFQTLAIDLTSIVSRSDIGEDVRGETYKNVSSSKAGA